MTDAELSELRYAERNHGRNFVTVLENEPHNVIVDSLTERGFFRDGGPSASGRWRELTPLGRSTLGN
jgi:hypothetical protein